MPAKADVMKELELHIKLWPGGTTGKLLKDLKGLIVSQDKKLKKKNK